MVYGTDRTSVSERGSGRPTEKATRETMTSRLMPAALVVRKGDLEVAYGLALRRAFELDDAGQVTREQSLYASSGFLQVDMGDGKLQLVTTHEKPAKVALKELKRGDMRTRPLTVARPRPCAFGDGNPSAAAADVRWVGQHFSVLTTIDEVHDSEGPVVR